MKKKNIYKAALYNDSTKPKYILDWSLGYESLIESALEGDRPQRSFILVNKDDQKEVAALKASKKEVFLYNFTNYKDLNNDYFEIDTTQYYEVTTLADFLKEQTR